MRDLVLLVILRHQRAGDGHLAATDVGVRVDGAGHDYAAAQVILLVDTRLGGGRHDAAVHDIDVANLSVHIVRGVVDLAAGQLDHHCAGLTFTGRLRWRPGRWRRSAAVSGRDFSWAGRR